LGATLVEVVEIAANELPWDSTRTNQKAGRTEREEGNERKANPMKSLQILCCEKDTGVSKSLELSSGDRGLVKGAIFPRFQN